MRCVMGACAGPGGVGSLIHRHGPVWPSGSAVAIVPTILFATLAVLSPPCPVIGPSLDALEPDPIVVGVAIRAGPNADDIARPQRLGGDAVTLETRDARPLGGVRLPSSAKWLLTHHVDPGVRILVLELEDFAFDFDRVGLDVVLGKRMMTLRWSAERGDADGDEKPCAHAFLHHFSGGPEAPPLSSFTSASRSALVIGRSGLGACTMT